MTEPDYEPESDSAPEKEEDDTPANAQKILDAWKANAREDLENWLETITELPPEIADEDEAEDETAEQPPVPDVYSFYEELAASNAEARKSNRRAAEAFSQWGETLQSFDASLQDLKRQQAAQPKAETGIPRSQLLALVDMHDRLERLSAAFASPPEPVAGWFGKNSAAWEQAWASQTGAARILLSHYQDMLRQLGLERITAVGQPFDPHCMTALAAEKSPSAAAQTVLEELAAGWRREGSVLRPAQVKVAI